ncbi:PREDICTED: isocitrate dehydrogenase [NAD] subunit 1, mitochondrial-like [Amphimedon queenslandica]|uniref:Isocitrate dehydrogenase [NAD] subunit, mitochondrial n=1 Tax=Amphimedon queenslandica TaxID=400682 RepID=A0A1X7VD09_AMPQE|nr:PREDICTED: isocitrate dehydrogenase [NAD] subunit 1, mitochondrial-like [Amphimedon queenslandica]|eukprot:XP_003384684.2 PREDICTED: isocitrate dehydrogenase [NAD] subunit 1, mitochondrial-like [Amphimedon queenslandica]
MAALREVLRSVSSRLTLKSQIYRPVSSMIPSKEGMPSKSTYGGKHTVTLIPGDGVGPELAASVKEVFRHANVPVHFEEVTISGLISQDKDAINEAVTSIKRNGLGLKGVLRTRVDSFDNQSLNQLLRKELDLFANVVYCKSVPGIKTRHDNVDIVIIRENTEGEYSGLEHESVPGVVESLKVITREKSYRIAKFAFDYAVRRNRKKVTAIHKANIMKLSDGLFLKVCEEVASLYPKIEFKSMIVDNCCMQMVSNPYQFDVMVMPNLYGNIVSNIGAGLVGGAGVCPGRNVGVNNIIFEPGARHSGREISARNIANPTAMLLSSVGLLRHLGLHTHGDSIEHAVYKTISDKVLTADVGGNITTSAFVQTVIENIQ